MWMYYNNVTFAKLLHCFIFQIAYEFLFVAVGLKLRFDKVSKKPYDPLGTRVNPSEYIN